MIKIEKYLLLLAAGITVLTISGCQNKYRFEPENTPPEIEAKYKADIEKYDALIKNPGVDQQETQESQDTQGTEEGTQQTQDTEATQTTDIKPKFEYFLNKAIAQERLGRLDEALSTYDEAIRLFGESRVIINNMGRIYEQAEDYEKAIVQYKKMVENYRATEYYYDLMKMSLKLGRKEEAKAYYLKYEEETGVQDTEYRTLFNIK